MNSTPRALVEKWSPVLNSEAATKIADKHKLSVTAQLLENTERMIREERVCFQKHLTQLVLYLVGRCPIRWRSCWYTRDWWTCWIRSYSYWSGSQSNA